MSEKTITKDEANYRRLNEPKASPDVANAEIAEFFREARELRQKYKLPDVLIVVAATVMYPDGAGEGRVMTYAHFGDSREAETMAAYAYGAETAERRSIIARMLAGRKA